VLFEKPVLFALFLPDAKMMAGWLVDTMLKSVAPMTFTGEDSKQGQR
jgi:hypothetical protein